MWCVWRWPGGVPPRQASGLEGSEGQVCDYGPAGEAVRAVVGGWRGCRGPNSIARRSTPCQAASVRGQSNQVLSEVLRAGASTAGRSLSTMDSIPDVVSKLCFLLTGDEVVPCCGVAHLVFAASMIFRIYSSRS